MLFRKTSIFLFISIAFILLLPGCISYRQSPIPASSPTASSITSPPISSPTVSIPSLSPTPSITLPPGTELKFEIMGQPGNLGGSYKGENAQIQVVSSNQTSLPEGLGWINPEFRPQILEVDYSKYFVVMVFNGFHGGIFSDFKILKIWQNTGTIFILAHFNDFVPQATSMPAYNSQYQIVKIDRTQIAQPGDITFKLLDESGQERATTTQNISK